MIFYSFGISARGAKTRLTISLLNPFLLIAWFLWQQHPEAVPEVAEERDDAVLPLADHISIHCDSAHNHLKISCAFNHLLSALGSSCEATTAD